MVREVSMGWEKERVQINRFLLISSTKSLNLGLRFRMYMDDQLRHTHEIHAYAMHGYAGFLLPSAVKL